MKKCTFLLLLGICVQLQAQKRKSNDRYFDAYVAPALGFRVLMKAEPPANYYASEKFFKDSLNAADRPGQALNFGIAHVWKQNAFESFSLGLNLTTLNFRRVRENLKIGDDIHPDVGVVAGLIQVSDMKVNYDYTYRYLEASALWMRSAEGYGNLKDLNLWYVFGVSPAVVVKDFVHVRTVGFTLNETNTFKVKDKDIQSFAFNTFATVALRAEYKMHTFTDALVMPQLRIPLLPSGTGKQSIFLPQFALNIGVTYKITNHNK